MRIRRDDILYPTNLYTGIAVAIIYCFVFWKFSNLGRFRIPLFFYSVMIQLAFLGLFAWMNNRFRANEHFSHNYVDLYGDGIVLFYFLLVMPLLGALWVHTYKGIEKLNFGKMAGLAIMGMFIVFCLICSIIGFYLHVFFYYGFAP